MRKFKRAVTDSDSVVRRGECKHGINNLMDIYAGVTGKTFEEIEREFDGQGYGAFKTAVGEAVVEELRPVQEKYAQLMNDKAYLEQCWHDAAPKAEAVARRTLQKVMRKVGYIL